MQGVFRIYHAPRIEDPESVSLINHDTLHTQQIVGIAFYCWWQRKAIDRLVKRLFLHQIRIS